MAGDSCQGAMCISPSPISTFTVNSKQYAINDNPTQTPVYIKRSEDASWLTLLAEATAISTQRNINTVVRIPGWALAILCSSLMTTIQHGHNAGTSQTQNA